MKFEWAEQMKNHKRVLMRGARRSGKTYAAVEWAYAAEESVVFVGSTQSNKEARELLLARSSRDEIFSHSRTEIVYANQKTVRFLEDGELYVRGLEIRNLVLDNADTLDNAYLLALFGRVRHPLNLFATYGWRRSAAVKTLEQVEGVHFVSVDYLDLLETQAVKASDIRELKLMMSPEHFAAEFGPYEKKTQKVITNRSLKYLLEQSK